MTDDPLDLFLAHVADLLGSCPVERIPQGARISGPEGSLHLRVHPGQLIELSADLCLCIGTLKSWEEPFEAGTGDMHWWAELSDAAEAWEQLGFELDQPGAFEVSEDGYWVYATEARRRLRRSAAARRVLVRALALPQSLLAGV